MISPATQLMPVKRTIGIPKCLRMQPHNSLAALVQLGEVQRAGVILDSRNLCMTASTPFAANSVGSNTW